LVGRGPQTERALVGRTYDGISIQPLYLKAENAAVATRESMGPWIVSQQIDHSDPAKASELALFDPIGAMAVQGELSASWEHVA
jgi:methylmalonyl-CoA mutase